MGDFSIQQFEESGRENGMRFWYAHDFMKALGYDSYPAFQKIITRAMAACAHLGIDPTEVFSATTVTGNGQEFRTHKLSRFACFLVSIVGRRAHSRTPWTRSGTSMKRAPCQGDTHG